MFQQWDYKGLEIYIFVCMFIIICVNRNAAQSSLDKKGVYWKDTGLQN